MCAVQNSHLPQPKREQDKINRIICDNRAAGWNNVLIAILNQLGFNIVVQKPQKPNSKRMPCVPCVMISHGDVVYYDRHANRALFESENGHIPSDDHACRDFNIQEKSRVFNVAIGLLESLSHEHIRVNYAQYHPSPGSPKRRKEAKPRIDSIRFGKTVFTKDNIIDSGRLVCNWFCKALEMECKEVDFVLKPFQFEWLLPGVVPLAAQQDLHEVAFQCVVNETVNTDDEQHDTFSDICDMC